MTYDEAKEYAEGVLCWTVADLRDPNINAAQVEKICCYSMQPCGSFTPDEFVRHIEREQYRVEKFKADYANEIRGRSDGDEDQHPGRNNASTWVKR